MHFNSILAVLALPLLAVNAQTTTSSNQTTTMTSTATLTRTVHLSRVVATTTVGGYGNSTAQFPTGTGTGVTVLPSTTSAATRPPTTPSPIPPVIPGNSNSGAASLGAANLAALGVAGIVAAVLL